MCYICEQFHRKETQGKRLPEDKKINNNQIIPLVKTSLNLCCCLGTVHCQRILLKFSHMFLVFEDQQMQF